MTVQDLQTKLFELDIPHYYYNICGSGDDDDQRICLINEGGKWLVYYCVPGGRRPHGSQRIRRRSSGVRGLPLPPFELREAA